MRDQNNDKFTAITMAIYFSIYQFAFNIDIGSIFLVVGGLILLGSREEAKELKISTATPDGLLLIFAAIIAIYAVTSNNRKLNLIISASFIPAALIYINFSRSKTSASYFLKIYYGIFIGSIFSSLTILFYSVKLETKNPEILIINLPPSIFVVPNDFILIAISIPFILVAIINNKSLANFIFLTIGLLACLAAIFISQSRSGILVAILGIYIFFALYKKSFFSKTIAITIAAIILIEIFGSFYFTNKIINYDILCETRIPLWTAAWNLWTESIFFGHGAYSFVNLYQDKIQYSSLAACSLVDQRLTPWPHNLYLEILSNYGLAGAVPFIALILWILKTSYQSIKVTDDFIRSIAVGNFVALIGFIFAAAIELTLLRYWTVIMLFAIAGISVALKIFNHQNKSKEIK